MYSRTLPISDSSLKLAKFPHSSHRTIPFPPADQHNKSFSSSIFRSRICNSAKRLSMSKTGLRNNGGLVSVRCGASHGSHDDGYYIRRCVEIARKAVGCTSPNPMVGCVIVKDGEIVGEGFHPKAGQPHAEVFALRDAGDMAENATAYVSLEPCNHHGRTPPCTEALIKAKVKKVVVGIVDPNPIVASKGIDRLRDAGIDVTVGVEEELCKKLIEAFSHQMLTGKPFVTLRYTLSANGCLLDQLGEEVDESGGYYSQLLQEYDAIILSSTSLTENHPLPASKEPGANQPHRIILSKNPTSPIQFPIHADEISSNAIVFTDNEASVEPETAQRGLESVVLERINLVSILEHCKHQGLCSVLLDIRGNGFDFEEILKDSLEQNLVQKVVVEVLPIWGGKEEKPLPVALRNLGRTLMLTSLTSRISGRSVLLEGYF